MKKLMSLLSRRELLHSIIQRYRAAGRKDKQRILDEFVKATGYHRKYAVALLHNVEQPNLFRRIWLDLKGYEAFAP